MKRIPMAVAALATCALTGCAPAADREAAASAVALRMYSALASKDGATACAVLAPATATELAKSGDKDCAEAILAEDLRAPGAVTEAEVYGQWAQVRLSGDTVFLAVFPDGWRVVAAGCVPQGNKPYDCTVQGG